MHSIKAHHLASQAKMLSITSALKELSLILLAVQSCWALTNNLVDDDLRFATPSITAAQLLQTRGYVAEVHQFVSTDNYVLEITRGLNPLINEGRAGKKGKAPLLLLHGTMSTAKQFLLNSAYVTPRVYDDPTDLFRVERAKQLYQEVKDDPARRSLPFLAMNFGYEVWLLERRGFVPGSRIIKGRTPRTLDDAAREALNHPEMIGLDDIWKQLLAPPALNNVSQIVEALKVRDKLPYALSHLGDPTQDFVETFDREFWSFSLDEQAQRDLPAAIDFVLDKTGARKVHLLGYSAGGAISLMGLSHQPKLAEKISHLLLWAPAVNLSQGPKRTIELPNLDYIGPTPQIYKAKLLKVLQQQRCSTEEAQQTTCQEAIASIGGPTGGKQPTRLFHYADSPESAPLLEYMQLGQFFHTKQPCMFDYKEGNRAKYGQDQPPCYDLGQVAVPNITIYAAGTDTLVTPQAIQETVAQLTGVIPEYNFFGDGFNQSFNHQCFLLHPENDELVIVPSLLKLKMSDAREAAADQVQSTRS